MSLSVSPCNLDAATLAAALQWWRDAGVDYSFADEAASWLTEPEPQPVTAPAVYVPPKPVASPPRPLIGGEPGSWPQDLAGFADWWMAEASLDGGMTQRRVLPRGLAGATLMILVEQPESEDTGELMSGPFGKLLDAITAAIGLVPEQIYLASVLPRHMPHPNWAELAASGLPELTRHHIALAGPQRLIGFGRHVSSLLGHDPAKTADSFTTITHSRGAVPALMAPGLEELMGRPRLKARFWQALLDWQAG